MVDISTILKKCSEEWRREANDVRAFDKQHMSKLGDTPISSFDSLISQSEGKAKALEEAADWVDDTEPTKEAVEVLLIRLEKEGEGAKSQSSESDYSNDTNYHLEYGNTLIWAQDDLIQRLRANGYETSNSSQ